MPPSRATDGPRRRDAASRGIAAAIALAAMVTAAGCAALAPRPASVPPPAAEMRRDAAQLLAALAGRARALDSMSTGAVMEYSAGGHRVKAREDLVVERPDRIRVDARSPFGVALVMAASGGQVAIFEPGRNRFMRGPATAATLDRFARIPMAPADAVNLLMGLAPSGFSPDRPANSVSSEGATIVADYGGAGAELRQLGFSGGNLAMVRDTAPDGRVRYEVRYSEYRDIGGLMFPYVVDAKFPPAQSHVTFRYARPIVNGGAPASTFVLTPAPGTIVTELGAEPDDPAASRG
ncbi:MAG: hypothetical protein ACREQI_12300 [Candidatus Binataceae bacterium]